MTEEIEARTLKERFDGVVYACIEQGGRFVKIGWAASLANAYVRWVAIQIGNPRRIEMRLIGNGSLADEAALHARLGDYAVRGEWFRIEREVEEILAASRPLPSRTGSGRPP